MFTEDVAEGSIDLHEDIHLDFGRHDVVLVYGRTWKCCRAMQIIKFVAAMASGGDGNGCKHATVPHGREYAGRTS